MMRFVFFFKCSDYTTENGLKKDKMDVGDPFGGALQQSNWKGDGGSGGERSSVGQWIGICQ